MPLKRRLAYAVVFGAIQVGVAYLAGKSGELGRQHQQKAELARAAERIRARQRPSADKIAGRDA